jgi:hypothetical protein
VVRFELLADLDDQPEGVTVTFDGCEDMGAANLRGTGYAARDIEIRRVTSKIGGVIHTVEVNVSGLAGFLLAKVAAAHSRRKPKDWYDIAFVLLHNDAGGPEQAAAVVIERFGGEINGFGLGSGALLVYMALLSSVSFAVWSMLLKHNPVGMIAAFNFLVPIFGVGLSAVFLGERVLHWSNLAALVMVSIGIWLVTRMPSPIPAERYLNACRSLGEVIS